MFTLDLERLDEALAEPKRAECLAVLLATLAAHPGPYSWERLRGTPWQALVIRTRVCARIHPTTRARLEAGDPADGAAPPVGFRFAELDPAGLGLTELLDALRMRALGLPRPWRTGGCRAEAGFLRKVSVFPPPEAIPRALSTLDAFRRARPLGHPVWNALLLYLLLLRTHPWSDGNGRTMRLLLAHELWREGLIPDSVLPLKRVLDANRANEVKLLTAVSRFQHDPARGTDAFADALTFLARVLGLGAVHASMAAQSRRTADARSR